METCRGSQSFGMHMSATVVSPRVFFRVCSILNAHEIVHTETPTWRSKVALFSITVARGVFSEKVSQWYFLLMVGVWHLFS